MVSGTPTRSAALLPLLLVVPPGAVVGVPAGLLQGARSLHEELRAFGPVVRTEGELRHAVSRAPVRVVLETDRIPLPLVEAALPVLRRARAAAVLYSDDRGFLAHWSERVLHRDAAGLRWTPSEAVRAGRRLELRIERGSTGQTLWLRFGLQGAAGAEAVLSAVRASGIRVCESRIIYEASGAR